MRDSTPDGSQVDMQDMRPNGVKTIRRKTAGLDWTWSGRLQVVASLDILLPAPPRVMNLISTIFADGRVTTQCEAGAWLTPVLSKYLVSQISDFTKFSKSLHYRPDSGQSFPGHQERDCLFVFV